MFNSATGLPDQMSMYSRSKIEAYKTGDKTSPISVILVSSGSRGNKLLFRYPFQRVAECPSSPAGGIAFSSKCTRQTLSALIFSFFFFNCQVDVDYIFSPGCSWLVYCVTSHPFRSIWKRAFLTCQTSDTQLLTFTCWKTLIKSKKRLFEIGSKRLISMLYYLSVF